MKTPGGQGLLELQPQTSSEVIELLNHPLSVGDGFPFRLEGFESLGTILLPGGNPSVVAVFAHTGDARCVVGGLPAWAAAPLPIAKFINFFAPPLFCPVERLAYATI